MGNQRTFGRRANSQPQASRASAVSVAQSATVVSDGSQDEWVAPPTGDFPTHDAELEEWKRNRSFQIPWRQLSLMASLCFGVASLVLPASVNDSVDWLLYALMAVSFVVGISRRRQKAKI